MALLSEQLKKKATTTTLLSERLGIIKKPAVPLVEKKKELNYTPLPVSQQPALPTQNKNLVGYQSGQPVFGLPQHLGGGTYTKTITEESKKEARNIPEATKKEIAGNYSDTLKEVNHIISVARGGTNSRQNLEALKTNLTFQQKFQRLFGKKFETSDFTQEQRQEGRVAVENALDKKVKSGEISNEEAIVRLKGWDFLQEQKKSTVKDVVKNTIKGFPKALAGGFGLFTKALPDVSEEFSKVVYQKAIPEALSFIEKAGKATALTVGAPIAIPLSSMLTGKSYNETRKDLVDYTLKNLSGKKDFVDDAAKDVTGSNLPTALKVTTLIGLGGAQLIGNPAYYLPFEKLLSSLTKFATTKKILTPIEKADLAKIITEAPGGKNLSPKVVDEIVAYPNKRELVEAAKEGKLIAEETMARAKVLDPFVKPTAKLNVGGKKPLLSERLIQSKQVARADKPFETAKNLTSKDRVVETKAFQKIETNESGLLAENQAKFGNVVNADNFRPQFKDVGYKGTNSAAVQEPVSYLAKKAFTAGLKNPGKYASFMSGQSGAGKTSALKGISAFKKVKEDSSVILDSNLSNIDSAQSKILEAVNAGKLPEVFYVYREPVDAFVNGVIKRMKNNPDEMGRVVPSKVVAKNAVDSFEVAKTLHSKGVKVHFIDNSLGAGKATKTTLSDLSKKVKYPSIDELTRIFNNKVRELYSKGLINKEQYNAYLGIDASASGVSKKAYTLTEQQGGVTINLKGSQPNKGYALSTDKTTEFKVRKAEFSEQAVEDYVAKHFDKLKLEGNHLGIWEDEGFIYLDVSTVYKNKVEAVKAAKEADQLGVFDLEKFETIKSENYEKIISDAQAFGKRDKGAIPTKGQKGIAKKETRKTQKVNPKYIPVKKELPALPKIKTSKLAQGVEAKAIEKQLTRGFEGLPEYATANVKKQTAEAIKLLQESPDDAIKIALGQKLPPEDLLPESVFTAVENQAIKQGDIELLRRLATESTLSSEATGMGQRIRMLRERYTDSPVTKIKEVKEVREKAFKGDTKKAKKEVVDEIKGEIKKKAPKIKEWSEFLEVIKCR